MRILKFNHDVQARWDAFVQQQDQGTFFHTTAWKHVIERTFGFKARYIAAEHEGQIAGVLPLFLVANPLMGKTLISTPFATYGGVCTANEEARSLLLQTSMEMAQEEHVDYLELRTHEAPAQSQNGGTFHTKSLYVDFYCPLDADPDRQFKLLPKDTRYMVRKGQKGGLRAVKGRHQLDAFYEVYAHSVRHLGTPVFSKRLFKNLLEEMGDQADIMIVWNGQSAVAGAMCLNFRGWVMPYYAGSTLEGRKCAANNFLFWQIMEDSARNGVRFFDFGRSKLGTGAYDFKSKWNMVERPLPYQYYLVERKEMPNFSPNNPRFHRAIEMWKHMPFPLTKLLGPALVKLFP
jgi:FemAB-related protein (PEP-CTERM system-associated)